MERDVSRCINNNDYDDEDLYGSINFDYGLEIGLNTDRRQRQTFQCTNNTHKNMKIST